MRAFTIGYAGMKFEDFVKLLMRNEVEVIVDVRRFPKSKYPEFANGFLEKKLPKFGIDYRHIAELGGFRGGYEEYMKSEDFEKGAKKLLELMKNKICCILCLERNPVYCHRRFIIKHLEDKGIKVTNL
jgi:uncharacterized protein (DUF488 family)